MFDIVLLPKKLFPFEKNRLIEIIWKNKKKVEFSSYNQS